MLQEPNYIETISNELWLKTFQIETVLELTWEWATVPFIARYRKEKTWNLDEDQIRQILELKDKTEKLYKAKVTAINWIEELWKMTPELLENIIKAKTLKEVEEIYKPYKSKKKTKAMIAIEKWFQPIADYIKTNPQDIDLSDFPSLLEQYPEEEILEWCKHIISAEISANSDLRADLIETLQKYWTLTSKKKTEKALEKLNEKDKEQITKFEIYSDFNQRISYLKPYQILAINRWNKLWIIGSKIEKTEQTSDWLKLHYSRILWVRLPFIEILEESFKDWYDTIFKSVENEIMWMLSELWEDDAIDTFKQNLANLLMTKPESPEKILAIDPGYKAGCKMTILDSLWIPKLFDKIFLHKPLEAKTKLKNIIEKEAPEIVIIWNWTGVNETTKILQEITDKQIYIVNESWASVYSVSKIAQEEFPELDSLDRWTVSIGRRYLDPLSELVKVPVWSIWVWMYQHDVPEKKLEEKLWNVVEDVVNEIWIDVNKASSYVLNHISGIDKRAAKKIYNNRPYRSREHLKKQLSPKVYEQAIWFLRVPVSKEVLDNTDIHPEQYELARFIMNTPPSVPPLSGERSNIKNFYHENEFKLKEIYPDVTVWTIEFIVDSIENSWKEKRVNSTHKKVINRDENREVKEWDIIEWVVRNVVAFWAFVDIGMKNDGLVHISQIADEYISDPKEFVEVGQTVRVKVTGIDEKTGKIQLSMKEV